MFKKGDKVCRIEEIYMGMRPGDIGTVEEVLDDFIRLVEYGGQHDKGLFELVNSTKETTSKWLKENAWYIRVESPEHSKLIQEWLFEHGIGWAANGDFNIYGIGHKMLTNYAGKVWKYIMWSHDHDTTTKAAQELLPQFQLVLKGITIPEAPKKTEQQLKLEELEATIQKAQQEIQQLKEMK